MYLVRLTNPMTAIIHASQLMSWMKINFLQSYQNYHQLAFVLIRVGLFTHLERKTKYFSCKYQTSPKKHPRNIHVGMYKQNLILNHKQSRPNPTTPSRQCSVRSA